MKNMSQHLLDDVVMQCLWDLTDGLEKVAFRGPTPAPPHLTSMMHEYFPNNIDHPVETSLEFTINSRRIHRNDIVAFSGDGGFSVGKVVATARCHNDAVAIVEQWDITAKHDSGSIRLLSEPGPGFQFCFHA